MLAWRMSKAMGSFAFTDYYDLVVPGLGSRALTAIYQLVKMGLRDLESNGSCGWSPWAYNEHLHLGNNSTSDETINSESATRRRASCPYRRTNSIPIIPSLILSLQVGIFVLSRPPRVLSRRIWNGGSLQLFVHLVLLQQVETIRLHTRGAFQPSGIC